MSTSRNDAFRSTLHILVTSTDRDLVRTLLPVVREAGHVIEAVPDAAEALRKLAGPECDLGLIDTRGSNPLADTILRRTAGDGTSVPLVAITHHNDVDGALDALRRGATDYLAMPIDAIELGDVLRKTLHERDWRLQRGTARDGGAELPYECSSNCLVGRSDALARVRSQIQAAVETRCRTVLLQGETGTGKEVVAHEIHMAALPQDRPFIAVSCPALPENLVESELFGHVKGSFTGAATDKVGCFEAANGGTLFLDEIGDLSPGAQAKLLRVLETRKVKRVGGTEEIEVDVRLIAATNTPLDALVARRQLRPDLFFRLNVFPIDIPPLRERREDVLPLARHFLLTQFTGRNISIDGFTPQAEELLLQYDYPGNVRELRNIVERAAVDRRHGLIGAEHLRLAAVAPRPETASASPPVRPEKELILLALERARWNRQRAASSLNLPYSTLRYKIKKYGLA